MVWVGFDVGGTFVEILSVDTETGRIHAFKHRSWQCQGKLTWIDGAGFMASMDEKSIPLF